MARRRNRNSFAEQAAMEAFLRFGPEISGLLALQREAEGRFEDDVRTARGTARALQQGIRQATPRVRDLYSGAAQTVQNVNAVAPVPAGAPASAQAAIAQEQAGFQRRMTESQTAALTDLEQQGIQAREGRAFAVQNARRMLAGDLAKILERRMDVGREQGVFTALTARQLRQEAQDRADRLFIAQGGWTQQERNSLRSAGIDPDSGKPIPGGPLTNSNGGGSGGNEGRGWASQEQHAAAQDQISEAQRWAKDLKSTGLSRAEIARALTNGRKAQPVFRWVDDGKGGRKKEPVLNRDGTPKMSLAVPKMKSQLLLSAALDEVFDGHLSRLNTRRLHSRRLRIQDLPLTTYQEWRQRAYGGGAGQHPRT